MKEVTTSGVIDLINKCDLGITISEDNLNESLISLGMDSVGFINIVVAIEEEYDCEFPDSKLIMSEMDTVQKIISILKSLFVDESEGQR